MVEWWYPVVVWAIVIGAVVRSIQVGMNSTGLSHAGPRWLPLVAGALAIVPIDGLPLARWLHSFNANFSIPLSILLLDFGISPLLRKPLLNRRATLTAIWFGCTCGLLLYPLSLGLGSFDPYELGWKSPGVAAAAAMCGGVLLLQKNTFGAVLLVAGAAWQIGCLESDNAWDYLIDPVYWLLSTINVAAVMIGWLVSVWQKLRGPTSATLIGAILVGSCSLYACKAEDQNSLATPIGLDEKWQTAAAELHRRATSSGNERLALLIRDWRLPDEAGRTLAVTLPPKLEQPEWILSADAQAIWSDFCDARRQRAAGTFAMALAAARARGKPPASGDRGDAEDSVRPAMQQQSCAAVRLLYRTLRDDPEHAQAREAGGWVRRGGSWVWPEAARRLDKGEEYSAAYGWLPKGRLARYEAGDRYVRGRWMKASEDAAKPRTLNHGWKCNSDHWQIASTASHESIALLVLYLEESHSIWRQIFGAFSIPPAELEKRLEGRGRIAARDPFAAVLLANRKEYVAEMEALEPTIARTLGIYWSPTHTAWFFDSKAQHDPADDAFSGGLESTTIYHEATHQLFAETRVTSPLAGERFGFWAIEAAACFMESLQVTDFGWTLGGIENGRAPAARQRLLEDNFYVPLEELTAMGRREFQADARLPEIYSQISGLADFFMNGQRGRYREAFVEYLVRIYTGTVDADTLWRLCKRSASELDDEYRRHMAR